jgi:flagellin
MNSLITNGSALAALSALRSRSAFVDGLAKQVSSGFRVNDAGDDAAIFQAAQGVRANVKAYASVQSSLSAGVGLGQVTLAAVNKISGLVGDIKAKIANLADGSASTAQQDVYRGDIGKLIDQVNNFIGQARYHGSNILAGDAQAAPLDFVSDVNGNSLSFSTQHRLDWDSDQFLGPNLLFTDPSNVTDNVNKVPPDITGALQGLASFESRVTEISAAVAAQTRAFTQQKGFIDNLVDALKGGLGNLIDADVAADTASLEAGRVAQQLAVQSLALANQQPSALLQLLR